MEHGVDLSVAQRHYKGLVKAGKHREAGALMTICTGACWSLITHEEAKRPLWPARGRRRAPVLGMLESYGVARPIHPKIKPILCGI